MWGLYICCIFSPIIVGINTSTWKQLYFNRYLFHVLLWTLTPFTTSSSLDARLWVPDVSGTFSVIGFIKKKQFSVVQTAVHRQLRTQAKRQKACSETKTRSSLNIWIHWCVLLIQKFQIWAGSKLNGGLYPHCCRGPYKLTVPVFVNDVRHMLSLKCCFFWSDNLMGITS